MKSNNNISKTKQKTYHYVYIVLCLLTGEFYFGKHSTNNKNDGYGGSGSELNKRKKEIGSEHFEITLFARFNSEEEAYDVEEDLIRCFISDIKSLNKRIRSRSSMCDHSTYIYPSGKIAKLHINDPDVLSGFAVGVTKGKPSWNKGKPSSEETKIKISKSRKGKNKGIPSLKKGIKIGPLSESHRMAISKGNKGKLKSEETKRKISETKKGKPNPKISELKKGKPAWNKGLKTGPNPKVSEAKKGKPAWNKTDFKTFSNEEITLIKDLRFNNISWKKISDHLLNSFNRKINHQTLSKCLKTHL